MQGGQGIPSSNGIFNLYRFELSRFHYIYTYIFFNTKNSLDNAKINQI